MFVVYLNLTTDMCTVYEGEWTWQIIVIAFCAAAAAGVVIILIILCTCRNRDRGIVGDSHEMRRGITAVGPSDAPQINGQNDSNKPEVHTYDNITDDKPATVDKSKTKKEQGKGSHQPPQNSGPNDSNKTAAHGDTADNAYANTAE